MNAMKLDYNTAPLKEAAAQLSEVKGVTDFCYRVGISRGTFYNIVEGKFASLPSLRKVCKGLNVPLREVIQI